MTSQLFVAFVTGLTTGGLSCLTVQGGLLAGTLAHQIEQDYTRHAVQKIHDKKNKVQAVRSNPAMPILLFLIAKIAGYTLLGALLGLLGSYLSLSPTMRALLMIAIGVFMAGNALRMFNVHPIFRYFSFEPPKFITRYIRRTAKGTDTLTPLFHGALTVFIPCGVTQAMMAAALGTGSAVIGAALMFAFTAHYDLARTFHVVPPDVGELLKTGATTRLEELGRSKQQRHPEGYRETPGDTILRSFMIPPAREATGEVAASVYRKGVKSFLESQARPTSLPISEFVHTHK